MRRPSGSAALSEIMLRYSGLSGLVTTDEVIPRSAANPGALTYVTDSAPTAIRAPLSTLVARTDES